MKDMSKATPLGKSVPSLKSDQTVDEAVNRGKPCDSRFVAAGMMMTVITSAIYLVSDSL